jgi:hypothetical protein
MDEIQIIVASPDGKRKELWAATGTPEAALVQVRQHLPAGWMVTLTGSSLTPRQAAVLDLYPNEVWKLRGDELEHRRRVR